MRNYAVDLYNNFVSKTSCFTAKFYAVGVQPFLKHHEKLQANAPSHKTFGASLNPFSTIRIHGIREKIGSDSAYKLPESSLVQEGKREQEAKGILFVQ